MWKDLPVVLYLPVNGGSSLNAVSPECFLKLCITAQTNVLFTFQSRLYSPE